MLSPTLMHVPAEGHHLQQPEEVATEILETLDELGVTIEARPGGGLYYSPRRVVGPRLRALLIQYKPELQDALREYESD
jgi:hypothetical protein